MDVKDDHLTLVKEILATIIPDRRVVAFGSRVTQTACDTSDLDLCIMGGEPLSFDVLAALRQAFSESNIPYRVDVVDWASADEAFQNIIQEKFEIIQAGND